MLATYFVSDPIKLQDIPDNGGKVVAGVLADEFLEVDENLL
jgi:hypothetical protein